MIIKSDTVGRTISVKIILFGGFSKGQSADLVTQQQTATHKGQVKTTNGHVFMSTQEASVDVSLRRMASTTNQAHSPLTEDESVIQKHGIPIHSRLVVVSI
uniref:Uncharacterized protein LOC111137408 isoform X2 n=1 Tax=Crassostrea virginica TaxID=6565 RepID=A0A8B8EX43_CRAVI|nr:uncharacterized protein LOC111137408 isoform X2 [Crassostrea virginica]